VEHALRDIRSRSATQQPDWGDQDRLRAVRRELAERPALVRADDTRRLRGLLARAAAGEVQVIQAGDCAEDPAESTPGDVARKAALLNMLAGVVRIATRRPVIRVGRIAGQYAKPRSAPTEHVAGRELPVYRGHFVNDPEPDPEARRPRPERLLHGYEAARAAMGHLGWQLPGTGPRRRETAAPIVWTSHEALLLDYELPLLRADGTGGTLLASTHWPWIGERTRDVEGAHVGLLSLTSNPVACKVGPGMRPEEVVELCARLDPGREPGRLTLVARMGARAVTERLPALVAAVRAARHPVVWLTDPMHGNTVTTPDGLKTRLLSQIAAEIHGFQQAVRAEGGVAGGLHLETTPDSVTECVDDLGAENAEHTAAALARVGDKYTSFCDPRLNPRQAMSVLRARQRRPVRPAARPSSPVAGPSRPAPTRPAPSQPRH
jgi:3-deoxy-7-phosphoheptulonate synthase